VHRTQIYFEESLFEEIKQKAGSMNLSVSAYIRDILRAELDSRKQKEEPVDFSDFAGMWQDHDVTQENIREKAWK